MTDGGLLRRHPTSRRERGFTLVELAVVVLVVGLLIGSLLVPLSTQVDQRNAAETQRRLEDAREALIGFAVANGRFPCPATSTSNGQESFCTNTVGACGPVILSPTSAPPSHGRCTNFYDGFLPGQVLGLNNQDASGYALDAYPLANGQGRIRYVIADLTIGIGPGTPHGLTANNAMRTASMLGVTSSGYLSVCTTSTGLLPGATSCPGGAGGTGTLGTNVAFIVYSLGRNGTGASLSADETWNLNNVFIPGTNRVFVSRIYSDVAATAFDDQLLWVPSYALISRMVAAGALP